MVCQGHISSVNVMYYKYGSSQGHISLVQVMYCNSGSSRGHFMVGQGHVG
jgi:hypothetical protein